MSLPDKTVSEEKPENKFTFFTSDVVTLAGGTILAQIVGVLAAPLITRLFGPEAFGTSAVFGSIVGIIVVIACLRYELAIVLPKSDAQAANIFAVCILIALIIGIITIPFVIFFQNEIAFLLNSPHLISYLWLIPVAVFIGGIFLPLTYWNARAKDFKNASISKISGSVSTTGTQLGSGILGFGTAGSLIYATLIGQLISTLYLGIIILKHDLHLFKTSINLPMMIGGVRRYVKFPLLDTTSAFLNTASWQLPIILLAVFYSPAIAGFYSLSVAIIQLPTTLVGNSISQAFFPHSAEALRQKELFILVENLFKILLIIIAFPLLTLMIVGGNFFTVIFGNNWAEAGVFAQILSLFFLVNFILNPLSSIYIILEKQLFGLYYNIINFSSRLAALIIGGLFFDVRIALVLFAGVGIFTYLVVLVKLMKFANVRWKIIKQHLISTFSLFIPAGLLLIFVEVFVRNATITVLIASLSVVIYYLYILKTNDEIRDLVYSFKFW